MGQATFKAFQDRAGIYALDAYGTFELNFNTGVSAIAKSILGRVMPRIDAQSPVQRFASIRGVSEFKPFMGNIEYLGVDDWTVTANSYSYGNGVSIDYISWKADQKNLDKYALVPAYLAQKALKLPFALLSAFLEANPTWSVDGLSFFNDSHFFGDNSLSVNVTSPTNPTEQDWRTVIDAVTTAYGSFTDDHSQPLVETVEVQNMVMIAPSKYASSLRRLARVESIPVVFGTNTAAAATSNIDQGTFSYLATPRLTEANNVVYVCLTEPSDELLGAGGTAPCFINTVFDEFRLMVADPNTDPRARNEQIIETAAFGNVGITGFNAAKVIKVALT